MVNSESETNEHSIHFLFKSILNGNNIWGIHNEYIIIGIILMIIFLGVFGLWFCNKCNKSTGYQKVNTSMNMDSSTSVTDDGNSEGIDDDDRAMMP
mmetsp:Transcript_13127/g.16223  ORF Transcript_13127/g.16223 Transcript_13127/m.16223 type:complete len:96 (+) Transcript_13127:989-1276(+)